MLRSHCTTSRSLSQSDRCNSIKSHQMLRSVLAIVLIDRKINFTVKHFFLRTRYIFNRYHCIRPHCIISKRNMSHWNVPPHLKQTTRCSAFSFDMSLWSFGLYRYMYILRGRFIGQIMFIFHRDRKKNHYSVLSKQSTSEIDERIVTYMNLYARTQAS